MRTFEKKTYEKAEKKPLIAALESDHESEKELNEFVATGTSDGERGIEICPITNEVMKDPVIAPDDITYERKAIADWVQRKGTSPYTGQPMVADFRPNIALKNQIAETKRLTDEKKRLEREKEKIEREKAKKEKKLQKTKESRKQDQEDFKLEMRKFMEEQRQRDAERDRRDAERDEKIEAQERKIEELDAHIRANTAKARGTLQSRKDYLKANAREKAGTAGLVGFGAVTATGAVFGGIELAAYLGVTGAAALIPGPGWVVAIIMGGVAVVAFCVSAGVYYYYLHMDEREYARDKHLIDAALRDAVNQRADGKSFDAMKAFADQHKLTLAGLPHTIFYAIAEVAKGAYSKVLEWRSGLAPAPTVAYQLQYIQSLRMDSPTIEAAKDHPVHHRIYHMTENGEMPVSSCVPGPHYMPDVLIREGNQAIKDATPSNTEMVRSAMLQLSHTAVSTVATSVADRDEPNFLIVVKQASVIDKEWVRQQEALANPTIQ